MKQQANIERILKQQVDPRKLLRMLSPEQRKLLRFLDGITLLQGPHGVGKTTVAVKLLKKLQVAFNLPAVCDFPLKEAFGTYRHIDMEAFLENLKLIAVATMKGGKAVADRALHQLVEQQLRDGLVIENSVMLLDEAYRWANSRHHGRKEQGIFVDWIQQIRHYRVALIMVAPDIMDLDYRVRRQIDRIGNCFIDKATRTKPPKATAFIYARRGADKDRPFKLVVNAQDSWELFDSWVLTPLQLVNRLELGREENATD